MNAVGLFKATWQQYSKHNGQWLAAALAYFAAFSIAPLIIVLVEIAGAVLGGHRRTLQLIYGYLNRDAGHSAASAVQSMVTSTFNQPRTGAIAEIVGWAVFVIAAIGLFSAVQFALNTIWDVKPKESGIMLAILQRVSAFAVMAIIALLLLVSIFVNAALNVATGYLAQLFAGADIIAKIVDFAVSFGVLWLAFALLFEYLPDTRIEWRDVWKGSAMTAFLFVVGQFLLGWYLGRAGMTSSYGAFGALVVLLIWFNYSAQIVLFGAEYTHVYALRHGSRRQQSGATRGEVILTDQPRVRPR